MEKDKTKKNLVIATLFSAVLIVIYLNFDGQESDSRALNGTELPTQSRATRSQEIEKERHNLDAIARFQPAEYNILYGADAGKIGIHLLNEGEPIGPESFAVLSDGRIALCDPVNNRVSIYSQNAQFLFAVTDLPCYPNDIATIGENRMLLYDHSSRMLFLIDENGKRLSTLQIQPDLIDTRGYMHIVKNKVYFANGSENDRLIALVDVTALTPPKTEEAIPGIVTNSDKRLIMAVARGKMLDLHLQGDSDSGVRSSLEVEGLLSATFIGEAEDGPIGIQIERDWKSGVHTQIILLTPDLKVMEKIDLGELSPIMWTTRRTIMSNMGRIVSYVPTEEFGVIIRIK